MEQTTHSLSLLLSTCLPFIGWVLLDAHELMAWEKVPLSQVPISSCARCCDSSRTRGRGTSHTWGIGSAMMHIDL
jgi:hypothetical protein